MSMMWRMNKIAVAFNEAARLCQSSGSEHSPEDPADLSDLVNSFFESDGFEVTDEATTFRRERDISDGYWSESETKSMLLDLLRYDEEDDAKQMVRKETEHACEMFLGHGLSEEFRRRLMSHLRGKGFDAGLCKSRWDKQGRNLLSGAYEYIDVCTNGTRYIVEVNPVAQFEIARPTASYASLLEIIPPIFVGKPKELKQVVKLMCKAMRESMEAEDMHLPPWRRSGYMLSKWFARYKRTVNEVPIQPTISFHCKDKYDGKDGLKVGYLTAAFEGTN